MHKTFRSLRFALITAASLLFALPSFATCGGEGHEEAKCQQGRIHYQFSGQNATANTNGAGSAITMSGAVTGPPGSVSVTTFDHSAFGLSKTDAGLRPAVTCWVFDDMDRTRQCLALTHKLEVNAPWAQVIDAVAKDKQH